MTQYLEFTDTGATIWERYPAGTLSKDQLIEAFTRPSKFGSGRLPQNTAFIATDQDIIRIFVEREPHTETIILSANGCPLPEEDYSHRYFDNQLGEIYTFRVPLPWEYYYFQLDAQSTSTPEGPFVRSWDFGLFWSLNQVYNLDDPIYPAVLPNLYGSGAVCIGSTSATSSSVPEHVNDRVNNFYATEFNLDLGYRSGPAPTLHDWATDSNYQDFSNWQIHTYPTDVQSLLHNAITHPVLDAIRTNGIPMIQLYTLLENTSPATLADLRDHLREYPT